MSQTILEINGVKYDAATGRVIVLNPQATEKRTGHAIDGIVQTRAQHKSPHTHKPQVATAAVHKQPTPTAHKPFTPSKQRMVRDISMVHHKHPSKSKTLMRQVVKKPQGQQTQHQHETQQSSLATSQSYANSTQQSERLNRAMSTPTHQYVTRFNHATPQKVEPVITHMPVASQAVEPKAPTHAPAIEQHHRSATAEDFVRAQLAKQVDVEPHLQKAPKTKRRLSTKMKENKLKSTLTVGFAVALLAGFLYFQATPTISLALANKKSGLSAKMPKGVPSNFALNRRIEYTKGQVTLSYKSNTDDRAFTLTQQVSEMNNAELESAITNSYAKNVQTYETGGIKLFISDAKSADWVDQGIRYNLSGTTDFTSEQLANIARSL